VSFSERKADSHGAWFGANGALETGEGSSIAIDEPSGLSGSCLVYLVGLLGLSCLLVKRNKPERPDEPNQPEGHDCIIKNGLDTSC